MTVKMTERDKKLLAGLSVFCLTAILVAYVILPLKAANLDMKARAEAGREQIREMEQKCRDLPKRKDSHADRSASLADCQSGLYPLLEVYQIDELLTERAVSEGVEVKRLQIDMPEEPADVKPYLANEDADSSNPDGTDGIWIAEAAMELGGPEEAVDKLVDAWSSSEEGIRVTGFTWEKERLKLRLEIRMSRDERQGE